MDRQKNGITEKILESLINTKTLNSIKIAFIGFTLLLSYISLSSAVASATTYYVNATYGNDSWPGNDETQPWRTIQHAADTVSAGATVYVMGGTYNERVAITKSGSPGNYITFAAYPGQTPIIDGTGLVGNWDGIIHITSANWIKVIGFTVKNSVWNGIMIDELGGSRSSNIIIQNNLVRDIGYTGIYAQNSDYITYDGNTVTNTQTNGFGGPANSQQNENVDLIGVNNFEIKNNYIYATANFESIDVKEGSSYGSIHHNSIIPTQSAGIYIDSQGKNAQNIDVYNNWIHDGISPWTRGIALATESRGSLKNVAVYNNIVNNNAAIGIAIASYSRGPIDNVTISSNTVYNNGLVDSWGGGIIIEYRSAKNIKIVNNIAYNNTGRGNLVTDNRRNSALYTNLVGTDPKFIDANNQDFHLQSSSPAIDNGSRPSPTLFVPAFDFDNVQRPQPVNGAYDIGAFEYKQQ